MVDYLPGFLQNLRRNLEMHRMVLGDPGYPDDDKATSLCWFLSCHGESCPLRQSLFLCRAFPFGGCWAFCGCLVHGTFLSLKCVLSLDKRTVYMLKRDVHYWSYVLQWHCGSFGGTQGSKEQGCVACLYI